MKTPCHTREQLATQSEAFIRQVLSAHLPPSVAVYLYGSRARGDNRWNSDYDIWVDSEIPKTTLRRLVDELDESFVPFKVDIITTGQVSGNFGLQVKREATPWM